MPQRPTFQLLPRPRWHHIDGPDVALGAATVIEATDPESDAWERLRDLQPSGLPAEGYALRIDSGETGPRVTIAARDAAGLRFARVTIDQLNARYPGGVPKLSLRDWPALAWRGTIEGFYGAPWSHAARLEHLRFAASVKLNGYVYAPKDDPYHRALWRGPYPADELVELAELVTAATKAGVSFVYAIAPGLSMRYSDPEEHMLLRRKAEQLWDIGVRSFALLFDDVPTEFVHDADREVFGHGMGATGVAHGDVAARFQREFLRPRGITEPLVVAPSDYAGTMSTPYRERFAETLPEDALVWWTGADIVVGKVTRSEIDAAAASYHRNLVLWDNFPVNDFDPARLFLGPLRGRTTDLEDSALSGVSANPMIEATASQFALATVADWAWNPEAYDENASAHLAQELVAGTDAAALAPLLAVNSSWPPDAPRSRELNELARRALEDDADALKELRHRFVRLSQIPDALSEERQMLEHDLAPWLASARDAGVAGIIACDLLAAGADATSEERADLQAALGDAEAHYPDVLRPVIPPFARAVLALTSTEEAQPTGRARVRVLQGAERGPGDAALTGLLESVGLDVVDDDVDDIALTIVTRSASAEDARTVAQSTHPLLAWAHLDDLELAVSKGVLHAQDTIDVVAPDHPLVAGFGQRVSVYRGPGRFTWCEPAAGATIVARSAESHEPVIVHYAQGATLVGGSVTEADRVAFFLGSDGPAPWLMTTEGRNLLVAAIRVLVPDLATEPASVSTSISAD